MGFIKGKWGFLTNSEILSPDDSALFVWYSPSDAGDLVKK